MSVNLQGKKILLVEDDQMMMMVLGQALRRRGATAYSASNGEQALRVLETQKVNLVISDVQMPIMDGVELLKCIRLRYKDGPLVLLATGQAHVTEPQVLALGGSGIIHKPFNYNSFTQKVIDLLEQDAQRVAS
jgi:DNA-binding response OmpR family regulator